MGLYGLAFWGLLGAFVYGAPRLIVALSEANGRRWAAWAEFVVALVIGLIGAMAFVDLVAGWLGWRGDSDERALAVVIGLIANPASPTVVKVATDQLVRRLDPSGGGPNSGKA